MKMNRLAWLPLVLVLVLVLWGGSLAAEEEGSKAPGRTPLPRATPESVGLSGEILRKLDQVVDANIKKQQIAGAVTVVARKGKVVYFRSAGTFKDDSIVRIYSMSKPITVAAALRLVDAGTLKLTDPVSKYLPKLSAWVAKDAAATPTVMTVQHLMQHTSGLTYGLFGNTDIDRQYRTRGVLNRSQTLAQMASKLGTIPLLFEPGTRWHYSVSIDLLGRIIEIISKQSLDVFLREQVFKPLGMHDTGFHVPSAAQGRLVPNYAVNNFVLEKPEASPFLERPGLFSGGGGLVSTAHDYTVFALMLAQGGVFLGKRILSTESVRRMTTNQLAKPLIPIGFGDLKMAGVGFGLGVSVRVAKPSAGEHIGDFGWSGAASTTFFVSPSEALVMVNLIQRMPFWKGLDHALRPIVYEAVLKPEPALAGTPK